MDLMEPGAGKLELCLDFANTMDWHASDHPEETLHTYADLVAWGQKAGLLAAAEAEELLRKAARQPAEAAGALEKARALREALYRIFVALTRGESPAEADLAELNQALSQALSGARLKQSGESFVWEWGGQSRDLDVLLGPVARSTGALLTSKLRSRIGQCADDRGCGYLFLDNSKNHSRRWCNMGDCGNRAKQRRYYRRHQPEAD